MFPVRSEPGPAAFSTLACGTVETKQKFFAPVGAKSHMRGLNCPGPVGHSLSAFSPEPLGFGGEWLNVYVVYV